MACNRADRRTRLSHLNVEHAAVRNWVVGVQAVRGDDLVVVGLRQRRVGPTLLVLPAKREQGRFVRERGRRALTLVFHLDVVQLLRRLGKGDGSRRSVGEQRRPLVNDQIVVNPELHTLIVGHTGSRREQTLEGVLSGGGRLNETSPPDTKGSVGINERSRSVILLVQDVLAGGIRFGATEDVQQATVRVRFGPVGGRPRIVQGREAVGSDVPGNPAGLAHAASSNNLDVPLKVSVVDIRAGHVKHDRRSGRGDPRRGAEHGAGIAASSLRGDKGVCPAVEDTVGDSSGRRFGEVDGCCLVGEARDDRPNSNAGVAAHNIHHHSQQ
mmetsp:Transcript_34887/g.82193  ORF Transcript_34887/g.82193 Transcript_34887/m.82193 type:complete len:326 (+) Transcript_34887:8715-9692(+)